MRVIIFARNVIKIHFLAGTAMKKGAEAPLLITQKITGFL
jgi:hypothetical protein